MTRPITFRQMRAAIVGLQMAVLSILVTLDTKALAPKQLKMVARIIIARDKTRLLLKANSPRAKMLAACVVWYQLAESVLPLVPPEKSALVKALNTVLAEVQWIKDLVMVGELQEWPL